MLSRITWLLAAAVSLPASAAMFGFTKIADSGTTVPGTAQTFNLFHTPVFDGANVAFFGMGTGGRQGIYRHSGALGVVADSATTIPNHSPNTFGSVQEPSIDGGKVAFEGFGGGRNGLYWDQPGTLQRIVDNTLTLPLAAGGTYAVAAVNGVSLMGGTAAYYARNLAATTQGIYTRTGAVNSVLVDTTMTLPGSASSFTVFGQTPSFDGTNTFFRAAGSGGEVGVFRHNGASVSKIADLTTAIPGGVGNFTAFSPAAGDAGAVVFRGRGTGQEGLYGTVGGPLAKLVDLGSAIPGGVGNFTGFGQFVSHDAGNTLLTGTGAAGQGGLYLHNGAALAKIIAFGELLDGKTLSGLEIWNDSLRGTSGVFVASFTDASTGVYRFDVQIPGADAIPEPATALLLGLGLLALRRRR